MTAATTTFRWREPSILPGFGLALGITVTALSLIVLIPLAALFLPISGRWRPRRAPWPR